ncbi:hypothetical protein K4039_27925 [Lyngbya sp. CCAP 1446/10]|uniref:hypothetical protein n=1 Tax=Lyngbya sp. CCAP 1446/10 TaxID=439293 RepID=UPI002237F058|nr:hypothetical protein [Lyngbya sp. CCAP 1446/10]MCW6053775.1 hypothetical protein [Lyngbya sp. CCAP 1446/10]
MKHQDFCEEFAFLLVKYKATHKAKQYGGVPLSSICCTLRGLLNMRTEGVNLTSEEHLFLKEWGWIMDLSPSNPLYEILKQVDSGKKLSKEETRALKKEQQKAKIILEREEQEAKIILEREEQEAKIILEREEQGKIILEREEQGKIKKEIHLAELATKYRISRSYSSISHRLYDLLCKMDRGDGLSWSEQEWMKFYRFYEPIDIYRQMEEFTQLKFSYKATTCEDSFPSSNLYKILKRLDNNQPISPKNCQWLKEENLLETLAIVEKRDTLQQTVFAQLKNKYQATAHQDLSASSPLYKILKNLDADIQLSESEFNWLEEHQLSETLSIVLEIEQKRHFAELKVKYKAITYEDSSLSSHLYKVLKKIDLESQLGEPDINFLKKRKLTETITLALDKYAASLKSKIQSGEPLSEADFDWVKQNKRQDVITLALDKYAASLKSKIQSGEPLSEADFDWVKQNKRQDVITFAIENYVASLKSKIRSGESLSEADFDWVKQNKRQDVITFTQEKDFAALKVKYRIIDRNFPFDPFYAIMVKLEREERLDPVLVVQLIQQKLLASHGMIAMAYHRLEARFYEQEYERTGDKWNLPNASSHWRKAGEPRSALKVTENLDFDQIKENKLKSALLTTRGGAFRDIPKLSDAEKCALKAIEYQPQSHHPYTLMGAICYERGQYSQGDDWFNKAIKRGAESEDIDSELKRVVKNAKDEKRREVVEYLLTKNPQRYAWAKAYRKRQGGEDARRKNS